MSVPRNVQRFEALLYASLMLDALSVAVQDRTPTADMTEQMIMTSTLLAGAMISLLVYFVWLAAHGRGGVALKRGARKLAIRRSVVPDTLEAREFGSIGLWGGLPLPNAVAASS